MIGLQHGAGCTPPGREQQVQRVEPAVEQHAGGDRRQRAQRRHPRRRLCPLEEGGRRRLGAQVAPVGDPADAVPEAEEQEDGDQRQQGQRHALGVGPLQPVLGEVADAVADGRGVAHQVAPQARQQRARQALHQVLGEERVAQHRDLLDQLAGAHPGQLGRLDGPVERGGERQSGGRARRRSPAPPGAHPWRARAPASRSAI